jgi:hypothetical protein
MAFLSEGINTYVRDLISPMLHSSFAEAKPLTALLAGSSIRGLETLGKPNESVFWGGKNLGIGQKHELAGSKTHTFRYHMQQTDATSQVDAGGVTPTASGYAEDNVGTAGMNWYVFQAPMKVRVDSVQNARNASFPGAMQRLKIAGVMEEAVQQTFQRQLEELQSALWTGTLTSAQQSVDIQNWVDLLGMQHAISDGSSTGETAFNYYGGVDRTVETTLAANIIDGDSLTSSVPTLRLLRQSRLLTTYGAIRKKRSSAGKLAITTPDLWEVLADEAEPFNQINSNDVRAFAVAGFNAPLIRLDDMYITFDHDCPSGELYVLTPEDFVFEVHSDENFQPAPWVRKDRTEEGGNRYLWSNISAKCRLTCRRTDLNIKMRDMTTT